MSWPDANAPGVKINQEAATLLSGHAASAKMLSLNKKANKNSVLE
jgi:hypothetical protein